MKSKLYQAITAILSGIFVLFELAYVLFLTSSDNALRKVGLGALFAILMGWLAFRWYVGIKESAMPKVAALAMKIAIMCCTIAFLIFLIPSGTTIWFILSLVFGEYVGP